MSDIETEGSEEHEPASGIGSASRLMNRDFVLLWQGQLVSVLGSQAFSIAMMFWLMEATGSASLMGVVMMLGTLPAVLLGPLAGTLADRISRKKILVVCDALSGVVMLGLAIPFFIPDLGNDILIAALIGMAIAVGILQAFFRPAASAAIPDLVPAESVPAANSMTQGSAQLASILGQSLGGVLFAILGAPLLFVLDGLSYLFSALSESFIRLPRREPESVEREGDAWAQFRQELVEGLRYVWQKPGMREFLLLAATVNFFAMPIIVLLPFLVSDRLGQGSQWYGFLLAGFGVGALVGYVLAGSIKLSPRTRTPLLLTTLLATGALLGALGWATCPWVALALLAGTGILNGFFNILLITAFQLTTAPELRGRVMGVVTTLSMAVAPLGMAAGGVLGDLTGKNLPLIYGLCGGMIALATLLLGWRRSVKAFLAFD